MGYYTRYEISTDSIEHNEQIIEDVIKQSDYSDPFGESCKWYDHEEDCVQVSMKYPNVLITLEGIGEEQPDMWKKYFKYGKMQVAKAQIIYDDFDELKLQ